MLDRFRVDDCVLGGADMFNKMCRTGRAGNQNAGRVIAERRKTERRSIDALSRGVQPIGQFERRFLGAFLISDTIFRALSDAV